MTQITIDCTKDPKDIKEGNYYTLLDSVGAVGYAHNTGDPEYVELEKGEVVFVNKVVEDLCSASGRWGHTIIVSVDLPSVDEDGKEVEISYCALVAAYILEPIVPVKPVVE